MKEESWNHIMILLFHKEYIMIILFLSLYKPKIIFIKKGYILFYTVLFKAYKINILIKL